MRKSKKKLSPENEMKRVRESLPEDFFIWLQKNIEVKDPETGEVKSKKPLVFFPGSNMYIQACDPSDIVEPKNDDEFDDLPF